MEKSRSKVSRARHWIRCLGCFYKVYEPATECGHCKRPVLQLRRQLTVVDGGVK